MFLSTAQRRRLARRASATGAAALVAALALTACTGTSGGSDSSASSTLVAYTGQSGDYQINFNPYSPSQIGGIGTIYEGLFFVTNVNSEDPKPLLGTDYKWNDAGTELDVTLRDDAKWSDGEAFTADDVVFTFDMLLKTPSLNTGGFDGKVAKVDDTHVKFTWTHPAFTAGPFLMARTPVVPEHIWKGIDPTTDVMEKPVGTGPYTLSNFKPQAFTLTANPKYWGGEPAVKNIRYLSLSGNTAGADALAAGTIDWQTGPVPNIDKVAETYPGYKSITVAQNQMAFLTCSSTALGCTGPQTDPAVRQAIYYAINRTQLNSLAFENTASDISPSFALLGSQKKLISSAIEQPIAPDKPDTAKSDELLQAAGWAKGPDGIYAKGGEKLTLTAEVVTGWTDYITAIDTMGQQLKKAGIQLNAAQSSWNEWTDKKSKGNYELAIDSLGQGPASDPYYLYNNYFTTKNTAKVGTAAPMNVARFSDPDVDKAIGALATINPTDTAARQTQFDVIQQKITADMPYIPIMTGGTTSEFNAKKFTGWPTTDDLFAFPAVWASPDNAEIYKALKPSGK
ncbi:ABC transporter substrate-binding protein [Leifsonia sp. NPDC058292]|uniref:ABC transporter substrate-binding protein n=1 Tax=Leifsonia sp. NPDC058292 TaxID=3346428 RepID=UPI0036DC5A40